MMEKAQHTKIRPTTLDDIPKLRAMHAQSWRDTYPNEEYGVSRRWVEERTAAWLTPEGLEKSREFSKDIYGNPDHFHKVAVLNDEVVGVVHASRVDGRQHLEALYVGKDYHGKGVAHALMERAMEWCDPAISTDLEVAVYNERAKAFYRKYGFQEVPGSEKLFKEVVPIITMEKKGDKQ